MKISILLMVALAVACASAMSLEGIGKDKALPRCNRQTVGNKYPFRNNPRKFWLCTYRGLLLQKCQKGTWFNDDEQACVTDEEACEPEVPEVPEESEESEESAETDAPVESEESVEEPIEEETEAPVSSEESVEEPISEETEAPSSESEESAETDAPVESEESIEEPVSEEVETPASSEESEEPVSEETDAPPAESSEESPEEPIEESEEPASSEESEEPVSEETDAPPAGSSEESDEDSGETCKVECSYHGEYLPNPASCHSFYKCSWGVAYYFDCPVMNQETGERLVFNPTINVCDWPSAYECHAPGCNKPEEPQPECPAVVCEYEGQYLSNPANCHSFYQCEHADNNGGLRPALHDCPLEVEGGDSRLVWDTSINNCNWPRNVQCNVSC